MILPDAHEATRETNELRYSTSSNIPDSRSCKSSQWRDIWVPQEMDQRHWFSLCKAGKARRPTWCVTFLAVCSGIIFFGFPWVWWQKNFADVSEESSEIKLGEKNIWNCDIRGLLVMIPLLCIELTTCCKIGSFALCLNYLENAVSLLHLR